MNVIHSYIHTIFYFDFLYLCNSQTLRPVKSVGMNLEAGV